jgi:hypothetical protein
LPTAEQEAKKAARSCARRRRELTRKGKEEAEIAAILLQEFPPVDPDDPVRYIVSFPLDFDVGMHGCTYYDDSCGYGEIQKMLGCIDNNPLIEPLAPCKRDGERDCELSFLLKVYLLLPLFFFLYIHVCALSIFLLCFTTIRTCAKIK